MPDGKDENQNPGNGQNNNQPNVTFESWLDKQDGQVKELYQGHITGLKGALESERTARKDLEKQVRDLAKKAETGSESQKQLTELADKLSATERQNAFYDRAHSMGVRNLKLGYVAVREAGLIDDRGEVDWDKAKKQFPELFTSTQTAKSNGGEGTGSVPGKVDMNQLLRQAAGRN